MADDESITQRVERRIAEAQAAKPESWVRRHLVELVLSAVATAFIGLALAGALGYLDARHVRHVEMLEREHSRVTDEILTLEDYERFLPDSEYSPARQSQIGRKVKQRDEIERELERLKE